MECEAVASLESVAKATEVRMAVSIFHLNTKVGFRKKDGETQTFNNIIIDRVKNKIVTTKQFTNC